jgi:hypothetical protein
MGMKILLAAIYGLLVASAFAETNRDFIPFVGQRFSASSEGKKFEFSVGYVEVRRTPPWSRDNDNPPLSPLKAEDLAIKKLGVLLKDSSGWTCQEIKLTNCGDGSHWFYVVEFMKSLEDPISLPLQRMLVVVLMDGTIPEPKVTKTDLTK